VLPVTWLYFNAKKLDRSAHLDWATGSETNNHYLSVERAGVALSFESIGTISGQGNTSEVTMYKFIDDSPLTGINYYRLRQVDFDGESDFSEIRALSFDREPLETIGAHISNGTLRLWLGNFEGMVHIDILTTQGQFVDRRSRINDAEYIEMDWPYAPGVYLIRASTGRQIAVIKVVGI
jgi:hypothetical protein